MHYLTILSSESVFVFNEVFFFLLTLVSPSVCVEVSISIVCVVCLDLSYCTSMECAQ